MPRAFTLLDRVDTPEGPLELRVRGTSDFMISIAGRVLMTSALTRSELALAQLACARLTARRSPRILIGGLGLGYTLRAALDVLPESAQVEVAELNPKVVEWCHGPLAVLTQSAVTDPRVTVNVGDVTRAIRAAAEGRGVMPTYDAIVLDLYVGPSDATHGPADPLYGSAILAHTRAALGAGGVYAVWAEQPSPSFEARLRKAGFDAELVRAGSGGQRHAVYLATARSVEAPRTR